MKIILPNCLFCVVTILKYHILRDMGDIVFDVISTCMTYHLQTYFFP